MFSLKFPQIETEDASVIGILDDEIVLPSGKTVGSASLIRHIRTSGVWYERYITGSRWRNYTLVKTEVADAIKHWLINSEVNNNIVTGYADMPLGEYLKKMFTNND